MLQQIEVALSAQSTGLTEGFYNTSKILTRQLHVHYPENVCSIALRTEFDWDRDLEPVEVLDGGRTSVFSLEASKPFPYILNLSCDRGAGSRGRPVAMNCS